ncbi:MAG TPA: CBS domain-containing protein [Silvibacterium sp.]|nr:CBS domain-containing protein [Silvibacterium sp.]
MEEAKITSLVVVDDQRAVLGVIHLHDLLQALEVAPTPRPQP